MGVLGDKLALAIEQKKKEIEEAKNDINNFVWKGPKREVAGMIMQSETKLVDATPEQLRDWYNHCISMLFSEDKINPGRYTLKDIINDQIDKCTAELFLRWLENKYQHEDTRQAYPRNLLYKDLYAYLDSHKEEYPKSTWKELPVSIAMNGTPSEFRDVTVDNVLKGCVYSLGMFDRKHLSLNFLTKLGVEFTPQEMRDLTVRDEKTNKLRDRFEILKENLGLKQSTKIHRNATGLSYSELRAMLNLKSKRYSDLTTDQLVVLKNKVLFRFIQEVDYQISQWEERIVQLEKVAQEVHGFSLLGERLEKDE